MRLSTDLSLDSFALELAALASDVARWWLWKRRSIAATVSVTAADGGGGSLISALEWSSAAID